MSEPSTGVLLFVAHRSMEQHIFAAVRAAGYEATQAQMRLMARIQEDGNRLTELAEMAQVTKQTAQSLIDALEQNGLVERIPDPTDARARIIRLGERGEKARDVARAAEQEEYRTWAAHLGERDLAELRRIMLRLREITDPYAD